MKRGIPSLREGVLFCWQLGI